MSSFAHVWYERISVTSIAFRAPELINSNVGMYACIYYSLSIPKTVNILKMPNWRLFFALADELIKEGLFVFIEILLETQRKLF